MNDLENSVLKTISLLVNERMLSPHDIIRAANLLKRANKLCEEATRFAEILPLEVRDRL